MAKKKLTERLDSIENYVSKEEEIKKRYHTTSNRRSLERTSNFL